MNKLKKIILFAGLAIPLSLAPSVFGVDASASTANASPARTTDGVGFRIGPIHKNAPELTVRTNVPRGLLKEFTMLPQPL